MIEKKNVSNNPQHFSVNFPGDFRLAPHRVGILRARVWPGSRWAGKKGSRMFSATNSIADWPPGGLMLIPRTLPEWGLSILAITASVSIATTGDARLGAYVLFVPEVTLGMVTGAWSILFVMLGIARMAMLLTCAPIGGPDGVCTVCPAAERCAPKRWRPRLAALGVVLWAALAASLASGDAFVLGAGLAGAIAIGEFCVFTLLSANVPWIKSYR